MPSPGCWRAGTCELTAVPNARTTSGGVFAFRDVRFEAHSHRKLRESATGTRLLRQVYKPAHSLFQHQDAIQSAHGFGGQSMFRVARRFVETLTGRADLASTRPNGPLPPNKFSVLDPGPSAEGSNSSCLFPDTIVKVEEVVTDVLAMDLIHSCAAFVPEMIAGLSDSVEPELLSLKRSVSDPSLGETDIEAIIRIGDSRRGILIENKIRAPIMQRQFERYGLRGQLGKSKGHWDDFEVILLSPAAYYRALDENHRRHINRNVSYEAVIKFLAKYPEHSFKKYVFELALSDYRRGYIQTPDATMMDFYQNYYKIASSEFPELRMPKPDIVGGGGTWIYFPPLYAGNRVRLIHKFKEIGVELQISTRSGEGLGDKLAPLLEPDMEIRPRRSQLLIGLPAPGIDHLADFDELKPKVRHCLELLRRMRKFALRPEVQKAISSHVA
jgi:hypothetical protein